MSSEIISIDEAFQGEAFKFIKFEMESFADSGVRPDRDLLRDLRSGVKSFEAFENLQSVIQETKKGSTRPY